MRRERGKEGGGRQRRREEGGRRREEGGERREAGKEGGGKREEGGGRREEGGGRREEGGGRRKGGGGREEGKEDEREKGWRGGLCKETNWSLKIKAYKNDWAHSNRVVFQRTMKGHKKE